MVSAASLRGAGTAGGADGSREALLRDGSVVPALEAVMKDGLSEEARELAAAAVSALSERELVLATEGQKHVMLSCEFRAKSMCIACFMLDCCLSCGGEAAC